MGRSLLKVVPLAIALTFSVAAQVGAQSSLTDQINSVYSVQQKQEAAGKAALAARQAEQQRLAEQRQAEAQRAEKRRAAERAAAIAVEQKKEAVVTAKKLRDEQYEDQLRGLQIEQKKLQLQNEDQLRALQIEQKKLQLQAEKARVNREDDLIDAQLKRQNAETDVIQSQADATRNISSGGKVLLEKTGEARVKKESGLFN